MPHLNYYSYFYTIVKMRSDGTRPIFWPWFYMFFVIFSKKIHKYKWYIQQRCNGLMEIQEMWFIMGVYLRKETQVWMVCYKDEHGHRRDKSFGRGTPPKRKQSNSVRLGMLGMKHKEISKCHRLNLSKLLRGPKQKPSSTNQRQCRQKSCLPVIVA